MSSTTSTESVVGHLLGTTRPAVSIRAESSTQTGTATSTPAATRAVPVEDRVEPSGPGGASRARAATPGWSIGAAARDLPLGPGVEAEVDRRARAERVAARPQSTSGAIAGARHAELELEPRAVEDEGAPRGGMPRRPEAEREPSGGVTDAAPGGADRRPRSTGSVHRRERRGDVLVVVVEVGDVPRRLTRAQAAAVLAQVERVEAARRDRSRTGRAPSGRSSPTSRARRARPRRGAAAGRRTAVQRDAPAAAAPASRQPCALVILAERQRQLLEGRHRGRRAPNLAAHTVRLSKRQDPIARTRRRPPSRAAGATRRARLAPSRRAARP